MSMVVTARLRPPDRRVEVADVRPGESVLIHTATGGVGLAAIQLVRHLGGEVFATASAGKQDTLRAWGVPEDHIASSRTLDFADAFRAVTGGRGVDAGAEDPVDGADGADDGADGPLGLLVGRGAGGREDGPDGRLDGGRLDDRSGRSDRSGAGAAIGALFFKPAPPRGLGLRCAQTDEYGYAQVTVTPTTLTVQPRTASGGVVVDASGAPCAPLVVRAT